MGMTADTRKIHDATVAVTTQYAPPVVANVPYFGVNVDRAKHAGFTIDNPAGVTADYSFQVSNMTDDEVKMGLDDWSDYDFVPTLNIAGAAKKYMELVNLGFRRVRIKIVASVAGGNKVVIRSHVKGES